VNLPVSTELSLDIFRLKDESLEYSATLPKPDVIAAQIVGGLQAALDQFFRIAAEFGDAASFMAANELLSVSALWWKTSSAGGGF
jgi:hypothetical protein